MDSIEAEYYFPFASDENNPAILYPLTEEGIDSIPDNITHGNYRIGILDEVLEVFHVKYIGRADNGLKNRVSDHLTDFIKDLIDNNPGRVYFSFNSEINELDSYHHECRNYHDFIPELNDIHPKKPSYPPTFCKICGE